MPKDDWGKAERFMCPHCKKTEPEVKKADRTPPQRKDCCQSCVREFMYPYGFPAPSVYRAKTVWWKPGTWRSGEWSRLEYDIRGKWKGPVDKEPTGGADPPRFKKKQRFVISG
jgi:hypothetical protein